jgi:hypothetical protein
VFPTRRAVGVSLFRCPGVAAVGERGAAPAPPAGRCPWTRARRRGAGRPFSPGNLSSGLCALHETRCRATRSMGAACSRGCLTARAPVAAQMCTRDDTAGARGSAGSQRCTIVHKGRPGGTRGSAGAPAHLCIGGGHGAGRSRLVLAEGNAVGWGNGCTIVQRPARTQPGTHVNEGLPLERVARQSVSSSAQSRMRDCQERRGAQPLFSWPGSRGSAPTGGAGAAPRSPPPAPHAPTRRPIRSSESPFDARPQRP